MKKMYFLLLVIFFTTKAIGQDTQEDLLKDIVTIENGKFTANDYTLLKLSEGTTTYQVKSHAEAPSSGVISRDNFVFLFTSITMKIIEGLSEDPEATTDTLDEIIGNPDIELNIYMNKTGFQAEVKGLNGTKRITQKWSDM